MGELEKKKNELDRELQIDVARLQSQLDVLGGQKARFLEQKITGILTLNQRHYLAVKNINSYTDVTHGWVEEAMKYFHFQLKDGMPEKLSDYEVYRKIKEERWPAYEKKAKAAFETYSEALALNMPILPSVLVEEDMKIMDELGTIIYDAGIAFHRAMAFTAYIIEPDECETTVEECMNNLREEVSRELNCKTTLEEYSKRLFVKSKNSSTLIVKLLEHHNEG